MKAGLLLVCIPVLVACVLGAAPLCADPPGWWVDPGQYDHDGSITAAVFRSSTQVGVAGDSLAAFVGSECRGVTGLWEAGLPTFQLFLMNVYSNAASGESLSFRYYDSVADAVCDISERVEFAPDMIVGGIMTPFEMNTSNCQPVQPSNPLPSDGASDVVIDTSLAWTGGDPDPGDQVMYYIYFGEAADPPLYDSTGTYPAGTTDITYDLPVLVLNEEYFWKIVAVDDHGKSNTGHIWSFTPTSEATEPTTWGKIKALYR